MDDPSTMYDTYVYKIFKESIVEGSLPKYIMISNKTIRNFSRFEQQNRGTNTSKYLKYIKEVQRKYFLREGKISERKQLEDYVYSTLDLLINDPEYTPFNVLEYIIGQVRSDYFFFTSELDGNDKNLSLEIVMIAVEYIFDTDEEVSTTEEWKNITTFLEDINKFLKKYIINYDEIETFDHLNNLYSRWVTNNKKLRDNFENVIYRMDQVKEQLEEFNFNESSVIEYKSITYNSRISIVRYSEKKGITVDRIVSDNQDKSIWIFDNFVVDSNMPFVHYNDTDMTQIKQINKYYKIFKNKTTDLERLSTIASDKNRKNTIYSYIPFNVFLEESKDDEQAFQTNYIISSFQLDQNLFSFKIPFFGIEYTYIIDLCLQNSPFEIEDTIEMSISGSFKLYNVEINEITFMDMLLNDDILNTYFYSEESATSWVEKKRLTIHMKSLEDEYLEEENEEIVNYKSSLTAIISQSTTLKPEIVDMFDFENIGETKRVKIDSGVSYIEVSVTKAENNDTMNHFFFIFNKIIQYYLYTRENVEKQYLTIFPDLNFEVKKPKAKMAKKIKNRKSVQSKNELLRISAPEVFVANYARRCQRKRQPQIIESKEVKSWTSQKFIYKDQTRKREVLSYPPTDPKFYFGCPDENFPFVGVRKNTNLSNKASHPYIPCCFERPQMDQNSNSYYNEYYMGIPYVPKTNLTSKAKHKMITKKIIPEGSYGYVNRTLESIFAPYLSENENLLRYGVIRSVNSLLHCILVAIDDLNYYSYNTSMDKEMFVRDVRYEIFQNIEWSLGKQEMYDYDEDEIIEMFQSTDTFLDPYIFFRYFEEYFNVNIFTFIYTKNDRGETIISLEIPRFKLFHARPIDFNRKTILILKHFGSSADDLEYPQCELLIFANENVPEKNVKTFNKDITSLLFSIMYQNNTIKIWGFNKYDLLSYISDYPYIDLGDFKLRKAQIIDTYGKLIGLFLDTKPELIIMIPPTRPQNLPIGEIKELPTIDQVISNLGDPNSYSRNPKTDKIEGLWYNFMSQKNVYYLPIVETRKYINDIKEGPHNFHFVKTNSIVKQIHEKRIKVDLLLNYTLRMFKLSKLTMSEFISYFLKLSSKKIKDDIYEIKSLRNLSDYNTLETFMTAVSTIISNFVINNKLYFYSDEFYSNMIYFLRLYEQSTQTNFKTWENSLTGYYKYEESFTKRPFVTLIISEDKFNKWIFATIESTKNKYVHKSLNDVKFIINPIVYYDINYDMYFIVQPSLNLSQAINISDYWNFEKINYGINCEPVKSIYDYKYSIYHLSNSGNLSSPDADSEIKILEIDENKYYSLLQLNE
jgi:hypothetical protein